MLPEAESNLSGEVLLLVLEFTYSIFLVFSNILFWFSSVKNKKHVALPHLNSSTRDHSNTRCTFELEKYPKSTEKKNFIIVGGLKEEVMKCNNVRGFPVFFQWCSKNVYQLKHFSGIR